MGERIGIFIPCYNVAQSIVAVLESFSKEILQQIDTILAVDNHSTDGTLAILRAIQSRDTELGRKLVIITNSENYGLGGSQKIAFDYFLDHGCSHFMIVHGDNQGDGDSIPRRFLNRYRESPQVDLILASRFSRGSRLYGYNPLRIAGNHFSNLLTFALSGRWISDAGTGILFVRTDALRRFPFRELTNSFQFNPQLNLLFYEDKSLNKLVVPLDWRDSTDQSNIRSFQYCIQLSKILLRYGISKHLLRRKGIEGLRMKDGRFQPRFTVCISR